MPETRLRLEWVEDRAMSCASLGDYRMGVGHAFDGEQTTYGWSTWVAGHSSFAGGDGLATRDDAKAAAEDALLERLKVYRLLLCGQIGEQR